MPEVEAVLTLSEEERELLQLCNRWESFREVPILHPEGEELPSLWRLLDNTTLREPEEEALREDSPVLQVFSLLNSTVGTEDQLSAFTKLETLLHFPHHTIVRNYGGLKGIDASTEEIMEYRGTRTTNLLLDFGDGEV